MPCLRCFSMLIPAEMVPITFLKALYSKPPANIKLLLYWFIMVTCLPFIKFTSKSCGMVINGEPNLACRTLTATFADGEIKLSNPIRTKHLSKPSIWNDVVNIDQSVNLNSFLSLIHV